MDSLNSSTDSLFLQDASFVSLIESDSTTPRHPYNTRLSAKNSASKLSLISDISENRKRLVVDLSKSLVKSKRNTNSIQKISTSIMPRGYTNITPMLCDQPTGPSCAEKCCKYLIIFIAIGSILMTCTYVGNLLSDSQGSLHCVKKELAKIKLEMKGMKEDVQDVVNSRQESDKKLEVIEELLRDLKKAAQICNEPKKCAPKPTPKTSNVKTKKDIVDALKLYDEDKTGKTDYALESAGAGILGIRDTENYPENPTISFFGIALCQSGNSPRAMIQPGNMPGECWAFKGSKGAAVIKLLGRVRISGVSLEHLSKQISPSGDIKTAPKEFSIWGLTGPEERNGQFLGQFVYDVDGPSLQYFEIDSCPNPVDIIEFRVHTNNGSPDFTCVYRLRVHGNLEKTSS